MDDLFPETPEGAAVPQKVVSNSGSSAPDKPADQVTVIGEPKPLNLTWLARLIGGLFVVLVFVGAMGFTYPGSGLLDSLFGLIGDFYFKTLAQGNIINAAYVLFLALLIAFFLGRASKHK